MNYLDRGDTRALLSWWLIGCERNSLVILEDLLKRAIKHPALVVGGLNVVNTCGLSRLNALAWHIIIVIREKVWNEW